MPQWIPLKAGDLLTAKNISLDDMRGAGKFEILQDFIGYGLPESIDSQP